MSPYRYQAAWAGGLIGGQLGRRYGGMIGARLGDIIDDGIIAIMMQGKNCPPGGDGGDEKKPDKKKKGTQVNPDGSNKNPKYQLDEIQEAQRIQRERGCPEHIRSIEKSKNNLRKRLRDLDIRDLDD